MKTNNKSTLLFLGIFLTLQYLTAFSSALAADSGLPAAYRGKNAVIKNVTTDKIKVKAQDGRGEGGSDAVKNTLVVCSVKATIDNKDYTIGAPDDGCNITMTVNGVETAIAEKTYTGDVVITQTREIGRLYESQGSWVHILTGGVVPAYRTALYVNNGKIDRAASVAAAIAGARYDEKGSTGGVITSKNDLFNGIIIKNSKYAVKDIKVDLVGNGGNDFEGYGAGIGIFGDSDVTIENADITTKGVVRSAIFASSDTNPLKSKTGGFSVRVKDSRFTSYAGDSEQAGRASGNVNGMETVPWVLGLVGNNRMMNTAGWGEILYENCKVSSESWGTLSTDDVVAPSYFGQYTMKVTARNCDIRITGNSGYGSYSIGACYNKFDNCRISVPTYALIVADEYAGGELCNGTVVNSDRFGVMWHANQGGVLNVSNSTLNTGLTTFLVKGTYNTINVDRSNINAGNGIILQLMDSDDPGMGAAKSVVDTAVPVKDAKHDVTAANRHDDKLFSFTENLITDLQANFSNMTINGNFYNSTTNAPVNKNPYATRKYFCKNMILCYDNVKMKGVVSSSSARHSRVETINGEKIITAEHYDWLGMLENTPSRAVNNGVLVTLKNGTSWTVTGVCYLTALTIADASSIVGADGSKPSMTLNGVETPIVAGTYKGDIVINPVK